MGSKVFKYIRDEEERQAHNIELIASENFVSDNVLKAVGSCLTNTRRAIRKKTSLRSRRR